MQTDINSVLKIIDSNWKPKRSKYYFKHFFGEYNFHGKRMLDIGGGKGVLTFFAGANGASEVICLEPESAGSTSGASDVFDRVRTKCQLYECVLLPMTFQEYMQGNPGSFDIIVSNASINHLDEDAVINLLHSRSAYEAYCCIAESIHSILVPGGRLVISDCSRRNLFGDIGFQSPISPNIEWHKHQNPETWERLFESCGFSTVRCEYQTFNVLGDWGKFFFGTKWFSYFYGSQFLIEFRRK